MTGLPHENVCNLTLFTSGPVAWAKRLPVTLRGWGRGSKANPPTNPQCHNYGMLGAGKSRAVNWQSQGEGDTQERYVNAHYYTLLDVYSSTINQLPTQEGVKVRISMVVRANIKGMV